ncbi:MAG: radical SAM protein [Candidatus Cloacimonetes bacterium]|nr:radical SAM protein [Candidatus Cloacimonadota bacterium]
MKILPIFIPHLGCPFRCIYCEQHSITHTNAIDFPAIALMIQHFCQRHKAIDKEIAFFGGTFTAMTVAQQEHFFSLVAPHMDANTHIRFSTRPDALSLSILSRCKEAGVRTIELGIQSFSDKVLRASERGYSASQAIDGCRMVQDAGFDLGIQLMPGLPGDSALYRGETLQQTLALSPSYVRIYPTLVLAHTALATLFNEGSYTPLSLEEAIHISAQWQEAFSQSTIKVIKTGLHADISPQDVVAGPFHPGFGELVTIHRLYQRIIQNYIPSTTLCISPAARPLFFGYGRSLINRLKTTFACNELGIFVDPDLSLLEIRIQNREPGELLS